jgi:hypothetical protein
VIVHISRKQFEQSSTLLGIPSREHSERVETPVHHDPIVIVVKITLQNRNSTSALNRRQS